MELNKEQEELFWETWNKVVEANKEIEKESKEKLARQCSWNEYDIEELKTQQLYNYSDKRQKLIDDLERTSEPKPIKDWEQVELENKLKKLWE